MQPDKKRVGSIIKDIRLQKGLTMKDFGEKLNTSKGAVNNWEKGINLPSKDRLKTIAEMGNMTVDALLHKEKKSKYDRDKIKSMLSDATFVSFQKEAFDNLINTMELADFLTFGIPDIISIYTHNTSHKKDQIKDLKTLLDYYKNRYEGLSEFIESNPDENPAMLEDLSIEVYSLSHQIKEIENHLNN